jgi:hypothetical protein
LLGARCFVFGSLSHRPAYGPTFSGRGRARATPGRK